MPERMTLRGITTQMIRQAVTAPEETGVGYQNRLLAHRRFPAGRVKVVYVEKAGEMVVITAMWED